MAYPNHYLLQFGGPRNTLKDEMWTCGIRMVPVGTNPDLAATQVYLETVCKTALAAWFARVDSKIGSTAFLAFAKLNRIAPDGTYAEASTVQYFWPTALAGSSSPSGFAAIVPQAAVCLTWETDTVSRGLASRGRIYSPVPCVASDAGTGLFPAATALLMAQSAAALIKDLRGTGAAGQFTPNIVSDGGGGVAHRIDKVSVDNKVDIIRKRAASIIAVRSRVAVPA